MLLKNLAVSALLGTALSTSMLPQPNALTTTNTYTDLISQVQVKAAINIRGTAPKPKRDSLDAWLDRLAQLESNGKEHIKILDKNGKYSYGCLQFQIPTFYSFGVAYEVLSESDADQVEALIYNCSLQKRIAKLMIEDSHDNWRHWYTSVKVKNLGLPPEPTDLSVK